MITGSKGYIDSSCWHEGVYIGLYDPPKHEKGAIFRRKMSGIRMF